MGKEQVMTSQGTMALSGVANRVQKKGKGPLDCVREAGSAGASHTLLCACASPPLFSPEVVLLTEWKHVQLPSPLLTEGVVSVGCVVPKANSN